MISRVSSPLSTSFHLSPPLSFSIFHYHCYDNCTNTILPLSIIRNLTHLTLTELTQNDQRLDDEIHKRTKEVDSLQTTIQQWRAKIRTLLRDTEERNKLLLDEKHSIQKHYQQLKQRIQVYRASQNQRLLQLSQAANECKEKLKAKLSLAQKVSAQHPVFMLSFSLSFSLSSLYCD